MVTTFLIIYHQLFLEILINLNALEVYYYLSSKKMCEVMGKVIIDSSV